MVEDATNLLHSRLIRLPLALNSGRNLLVNSSTLRMRFFYFECLCFFFGAHLGLPDAREHSAALLLVLDVANIVGFAI